MNQLARRLARLEAHQDATNTAQDGYAPEAWERLAQWAVSVHAAGGWDAALAIVKAGGRLPEPYPDRYAGNDNHPHVFPMWDITLFWQRGVTCYPTREQEQRALRMIAYAVAQLLDREGLPPVTVGEWWVGRQVWDAVVPPLRGEEVRDAETA